MSSEIMYDTNRVKAVWERVSGAESDEKESRSTAMAETEASDTERLKTFMEAEIKESLVYSALYRRSGMRHGVFALLACEEKQHFKRLETAYFIITGDGYRVSRNLALKGALPTLRERYLAERTGQHAYEKAALSCRTAEIKKLYSELSEQEERHMKLIEKLISEMLG